MRNGDHGVTSRSYVKDGTLAQIIASLEDALRQAKGELTVESDVAKTVADGSFAAAQV